MSWTITPITSTSAEWTTKGDIIKDLLEREYGISFPELALETKTKNIHENAIADLYDENFNAPVYFPEKFIKDLAKSLQRIKDKYSEFHYPYDEISDWVTDALWFEQQDLSDLKLRHYDHDTKFFEQLNKNLHNKNLISKHRIYK